MKKICIITLIVLTLFPLAAGSGELDGMVRTKAAYRFKQQDLQVFEQLVDLTYTHYTDLGNLTIHPTIYLNPNTGAEIDLKEVYVDLYFDHVDLRVGKQTVIWGEAEGAFITDVVSPRDMRSFILADFTEIRKAVPAVKADIYLGNFTLQGIWVTHHIPTSLPEPTSMWAQSPSFLNPGINPTINEPEKLSPSVKNSELFLSLGHWGGSLNWTVSGGIMNSDEPVIAKVTPGAPPVIDLEYGRYGFVGASMNTLIGPVVLRVESALSIDKPMNKIVFPTASVEKHHQVQTLVGLDWAMLGAQWSAQYVLAYTHDHHDNLYSQMHKVDQFDHTVTLRYQDTFLDEQLTATLFTYVELPTFNALIRPSISYSLGSGVLVEGGVELFVGDRSGTFGAYRDNTMAWAALRWYF
ncbi:MAG: DUF1302 family protein [Sphaerochaeta sp.]|jgi:hypothetical protein|nr:hypothetical protein [Spirochaetales bacterium]